MDRQDDVLIAEKVLGWRRWDTFADKAGTIPIIKFFRPGFAFATICPYFTADLNDAWLLVQHLIDLGYDLSIHPQAGGACRVTWNTPDKTDSHTLSAACAPEAVCQAALQICGVTVPPDA